MLTVEKIIQQFPVAVRVLGLDRHLVQPHV